MIEINVSNNYSSTIELNNELINKGSLRANEFFITAEFAKTYEELTRYVCTFNFRRNDSVEINGLVATPVKRNSKWGWFYNISSKDITALDGDLHLTIKLNNLNEEEVITTTSFTLHVERNEIGEEIVLINDAQYNALLDKFNQYYTKDAIDNLVFDDFDITITDKEVNIHFKDGSPKGVYANLSALQTAYPSGASGVYLTSDNGHWHYWNGTAWTDGGVYQSAEDIKQIKSDLGNLKDVLEIYTNPKATKTVNGNERVLDNVHFKKGYTYSPVFTTTTNLSSTIYIYWYKSDGTRLTSLPVDAGETEKAFTPYTATEDFDGYFSVYCSFSVVATFTVNSDEPKENAIDKLNSSIKDVSDELKNIVIKNYVFFDDEEIVSGTGTYVYKDLFVDVEPNTLYVLSTKKVTGATNSQPLTVYYLDSNGSIITSEPTPSNIYENIRLKVLTQANCVQLKIRLYASISGATTATYTGIVLYIGDKRLLYELNSLISYNGESTIPISKTYKSIAHRGYHSESLQNLGKAYINARKHRFEYAENDIQLTSDGHYVMWHDDTLSLIGDSSHSCSDYTLEQLKAKDFNGEEILTFEEWVALCKKLGLSIYVDSKVTYTESQAKELVEIVRKLGMIDHTTWIGNFIFRNYDSKSRIALLIEPTDDAIARYKSYLNDGKVVFNPYYNTLTSENVKNAIDNGFEVECYFRGDESISELVNNVDILLGYGVTGFTIDNVLVDELIYMKYF